MKTIALTLLATFATTLAAEEFHHANFSFTIPEGFSQSTNPSAEPGAYCVFHKPDGVYPTRDLWLIVEPLANDVPERVAKPENILVFRPGLTVANREVWDWNETKIGLLYGIMQTGVSAQGDAVQSQVIIAYLPVRPTSIRVTVMGNPIDNNARVNVCRQVLASFKLAHGTEDPRPEGGGQTLGMLFVFGPMAAILAAGIGFLFWRSRRKAAPVSYTPRPYDPPPQDQFPPPAQRSDRAPWEE